jgi:CubicO group peptidase (beta-lactamase class C family)
VAINEHPGFSTDRLAHLVSAIRHDIDKELYDGAQVIVARNGEVAVQESLGFADRGAGRAMTADDVFKVFSLTKAFINALVLRAIDRGEMSLQTRVVDVIPEFWGKDLYRSGRKELVNVGHLLTHRAGLPPTPTPVPYEELHDLPTTIAAICQMDVVGEPGTTFNYSPTVNHALLGEIVRRVHGAASFREVLDRELLEPLGMTSTRLGAPEAWADRLVPAVARYAPGGWLGPEDIEVMNTAIHEEAEMPWVGCVATAEDVFRFAEMLRRRGEVDGSRLLSPAILDLATRDQTGARENELYKRIYLRMGWDVPPASIGLGFMLRGDGLYVTPFGTLASPRTHGNWGAGSSLFWVEPERDLTFVCVTAGVMEEAENLVRWQRLSDLAIAAAV